MIVYLIVAKSNAEHKDVVEFKTDFVSDLQKSSFKENFVRMPKDNAESLLSFTFCFRIKLYSIIVQCLFQEEKDGFGFKFYTENYGFLTLHKAWIMFEYEERLVPLKWYHVCVSYDSGHILLVMNNKKLLDKESSELKNLRDTKLTLSNGFKLGLCNDKESDLDPLRSITRGLLTDFNMWSQSFSESNLLDFTKKCLPLSVIPNVINWDNLHKARKGKNVVNLNLGINDVCGKNSSKDADKTIVVIPVKKTYEASKRLCQSLGGNFPMFENDQDIDSWNEAISLESRHDADTGKNVMNHTCANQFWVPIIQNG